ncbi:MAG: class I SAM-dependent methyltransferase [Alphaproteobacteria bacterium]|nr:class I SAM-dependent methyltransferase [Alphaproteobacteria bacterium]
MHPVIFSAFERLCRTYASNAPEAVLEIGAVPGPDMLLNLPDLARATTRIGLNLAEATKYKGCRILQGNANHMPFPDESFDLVLCNSVLEHDSKFWLTLQEIKRVLRPGGTVILGVPGYRINRGWTYSVLSRLQRIWPAFMPGARLLDAWNATTPTLLVHNYPGDYYRFSEQALREVLLESFDVLTTETLMLPPRLLGVGRKLA